MPLHSTASFSVLVLLTFWTRWFLVVCGGRDCHECYRIFSSIPASASIHQPWKLIGRTNAEAGTPVFWSSDANSQLIGKVPDAGNDWGQKEKMVSEDEMAEQHHWCNGQELGQTRGDGEGQGVLACCSAWGRKELYTAGQLNNNHHHCIPSSVDRLLCCLYILAIMNTSAISIPVKVLNIFVSWEMSGIAESGGKSMFDFLRNCQTIF